MRAWGDPGGEAIHTSTFLGNPPACAAALSVLAELEALAGGRARVERGERLRGALEQGRLGVTCTWARTRWLGGRSSRGGKPARAACGSRALLEQGFITSPGLASERALPHAPAVHHGRPDRRLAQALAGVSWWRREGRSGP